MFIDKDSIIIDNISFGKYIVDVEYNFLKYWGKDTGRTSLGSMKGTLLGIFPKFIINFKPLTRAELELLAPIFNKEEQQFRYYDPELKRYIQIPTYTGDWKNLCRNINENEAFSISFISKIRRPK